MFLFLDLHKWTFPSACGLLWDAGRLLRRRLAAPASWQEVSLAGVGKVRGLVKMEPGCWAEQVNAHASRDGRVRVVHCRGGLRGEVRVTCRMVRRRRDGLSGEAAVITSGNQP